MADPDRHAQLDSLVERYLGESDPDGAENLLGELVFHHCEPLIRRIVGHRLGTSRDTAQDVDDVCANALLDLLTRMEDIRSGAGGAIDSFSHYTAVVAYHACHDYFRSRFPERHRLKNRLRYLLKPERGLDVWESSRGDWVCGWKKWRDAGTAPSRLPAALPLGAARMAPPDLLAAICERAEGPVEFDALVELLAELWGVEDQHAPAVPAEPATPLSREVSDAVLRRRLEQLWAEIGALPRRQRVALLLNLRAQDEKCALELFPLTGVASLRDLAALLEIPVIEFAELWKKLPLDDLSIADLLQVTRQQVINLRKSARKRLERRMPQAIQERR